MIDVRIARGRLMEIDKDDKELKDCYGSYNRNDADCKNCEDATNCFEHSNVEDVEVDLQSFIITVPTNATRDEVKELAIKEIQERCKNNEIFLDNTHFVR